MDVKELVRRCLIASGDDTQATGAGALYFEAAEALQQLQAENERLTALLNTMLTEENTGIAERRYTIEQLQAAVNAVPNDVFPLGLLVWNGKRVRVPSLTSWHEQYGHLRSDTIKK